MCDEEGGPPPEATQQMDAEFLQSIIEHIVSTGDAVSPFHEKDHQCYMFALTSLNDGELRQYDGTLNEIWKVRPRPAPPPPPDQGMHWKCDIPLGCCSFTGPWTVTRSPLRMLRRVAAFCRPLRPVLLLVSFPRSRSPVVWCAGAVLNVT